MDQSEGLDQATCDASTGEPGALMLDCDLPKGHEGDHHAEYEWPQRPPGVGRFVAPESTIEVPGWYEALLQKLATRDNVPTTPDAPTED